MSLLTWIKSFGWVVVAGSILTAVLMVLGGAKAGRQQRRADRSEKRAEELLFNQTKASIGEAAALQAEAMDHKRKAAATRQLMETRLERLGEDDEIADIAERFNARRVRSRPDNFS